MRDEILKQSNHTLYYPVDPTSRHDAFIGGTLSCNASGFVPGEKGATRFWVEEIEFMLLNGHSIKMKRGQYISDDGFFTLQYGDKNIDLPIPVYNRPKIKNASGLYSDKNGIIDLIDLIIGSEGMFGLITECTFKLKSRPKNYLDLFIILESEKYAIKFHDYLNKILKLEHRGYFNLFCIA